MTLSVTPVTDVTGGTAPVQGLSSSEVVAPAAVADPQTPNEAAKDPALSPRFAALARKEQELRRIQREIKAEQAAIKAKEEQYQKDYIPKSKFQGNNLMQTLQELGINYDQLTQLVLNQGTPESQAMSKLEQEIEAIKQAQIQNQEQQTAAQQKQYDQAVNQIRNDIKAIVASNPEFETIKETGSEEAVVKLIEETFKLEGTVLSNEDAAKQVEEYLLEEALKLAGLNKVKAKLGAPAPVVNGQQAVASSSTPAAPLTEIQKLAQQSIKKSHSPYNAIPRTLTNAGVTAPSKPLSQMDRRERAILALKGQLK